MFDIFEVIDLEPLYGEAWKGCTLKFHPIQMGELDKLSGLEKATEEEATTTMVNLLKEKFVSGIAIRGGERVEVVKEDLTKFPLSLMIYVTEQFTSGVTKKKLSPTTISSEATSQV